MTDEHHRLIAAHELELQQVKEAGDASSAEEFEGKQRLIHRRVKQQKREAAATHTPTLDQPTKLPAPKTLNHLSTFQSLETIPKVMGLSELLIECPQLKTDSGCSLIAHKLATHHNTKEKSHHNMGNEQELKKLAEGLAKQTEPLATIKSEHGKQAQVIPWQVERLSTYFKDLTVGRYHQQELNTKTLTQEELHANLRNKIQFLPLLTSDLETCLLREAGIWTYNGQMYEWPACQNGTACQCMQLSFAGDLLPGRTHNKFICTAMMYDNELDHFLTTQQSPHVRRPCIVCLRITLVDYVTLVRALTNEADVPSALKFEDHTQSVFQIYANRAGIVGGYHTEYCLHPTPNESIVEPVCMIQTHLLRVRPCEHDGGRICLDQSAMVFTPPDPTRPRMGETGQHFHKGDNKQQNSKVTIHKPMRLGSN